MNVVVSHVYSADNAGDAAILSVLLADLRAMDRAAHVTILTIDETPPAATFDGFDVRPSLMFIALNRVRSRPLKAAYAALVITGTLASTWLEQRIGVRVPVGVRLRSILDVYDDADLVVAVGGGYLRGRAGLVSTYELALLLHALLICSLKGKPVVLHTQSVGPFANQVQTRMAAFVLRRMDLVLAREDITVDLLAGLGVVDNVERAVDAAFAFLPESRVDLRAELGIEIDRPLVGFTVRRWLAEADQARYELAMAGLADHVIARHGADVIFIPQVTSEHHGDDDRVTSRAVAGLMSERPIVLSQRYDHRQVKALYGALDLLVGTRFHSVIFALTAGVPALAIEYEPKTRGIMRDLGLERWVVPIASATAAGLIDLFDELVAARVSYAERLAGRLPDYEAQAPIGRRLAAVAALALAVP